MLTFRGEDPTWNQKGQETGEIVQTQIDKNAIVERVGELVKRENVTRKRKIEVERKVRLVEEGINYLKHVKGEGCTYYSTESTLCKLLGPWQASDS